MKVFIVVFLCTLILYTTARDGDSKEEKGGKGSYEQGGKGKLGGVGKGNGGIGGLGKSDEEKDDKGKGGIDGNGKDDKGKGAIGGDGNSNDKNGKVSDENKSNVKGSDENSGSKENEKKDSDEKDGNEGKKDSDEKDGKGKQQDSDERNGNEGKHRDKIGDDGKDGDDGDNRKIRLILIYNPKFGSYYYNQQSQTVIALDYQSSYTAYYNGKTGEVFIFSFYENQAVYLTSKSSDKVWIAEKQSFEEYIKSEIQLKELYAIGSKTGISFNGVTITEDFQKKLFGILKTQSQDYSSDCAAYGIGLQLTASTITGISKEIQTVFDTTNVTLRGDIQQTTGVFQGFQTFFSAFGDQISVLKDKNIKFDLRKILRTDSGSNILVIFLKELAPKVDIGKILGKYFNTDSRFFSLISKLSGNSFRGYSGFFFVLSYVVRFAYNEISEQQVSLALVQYFTDPNVKKFDLEKNWNRSIEILQRSIKSLKLDNDLISLRKTLDMIMKKKWFIGNIDMSSVIKIIFASDFEKESVKKVMSALKQK